MMNKIKVLFFMLVFLPAVNCWAAQDSEFYHDAREYAAHKDLDSAYMSLRSLVETCPNSKLIPDALIAMGEYDYFSANYTDCLRVLSELVNDYPDSKPKIFAFAYLLEVAKLKGTPESVKEMEHKIISFMKVSLLFRDYKIYPYRSVLLRRYKAIYFIDKIEFYIDGKLFTTLEY